MSWSYRVMQHTEPSGDVWYGMHEYYVLDDGEVLWTDAETPIGDSVDDLRNGLQLMLGDLDEYPVLNYETGEVIDKP